MISERAAGGSETHQGIYGMTVYHTYTFYTYIKIALINLIRFTANAQLVLKKCISMAMNYIRGEAPFWGDLQN